MELSRKSALLGELGSPIREIMDYADPAYIRGLGLNPTDVISFAGGWVNHQAPIPLRGAYSEIIVDGGLFHQSGGYSPTLGTWECRQALADYERHLYGMEIHNGQIAVGLGSTQLMRDLFQILLDPDDRLLLLDPTYCNYPAQVAMGAGATVLRYPVFDTRNWKYAADDVAENLAFFIKANRPKVMLLVVPDNPTSQVLSDRFVKAARDAMLEVGGCLVIDFAYKEIVFGEVPEYFSWSPTEGYLSVHSSSKWSRSLGRRLGWVEAPQLIIEALELAQSSSILCPDMLHQMALARYVDSAIEGGWLASYITWMRAKYRQAALRTVMSIEDLGLRYLVPEGGLYTVMDVGMDGAKFVEDVLKETGVLFVPGWGFGRSLRNAVRISYGPLVCDHDLIVKGVNKVRDFLCRQC